jgi:hypothetical protein
MAPEYQPRRFFRNAPNLMLQRYFAARNVLSEVDFAALTETQVEPIYEAWLKLPDDALEENLSNYFHRMQGRGENCKVDC